MAISHISHTYRYGHPSSLSETAGSASLQLATAELSSRFPHFFEGKLLYPSATAQLLTTVAKVVSTRFYMPANMLQRIVMERDPVVTAGDGILRFEGFSVCCGAYARVDITPEAYKGEVLGFGTTNVDFNPPMRAALARVRNQDRLSLKVGTDAVSLTRNFENVVERKVDLPLRWLKGFVEVQSYQSTMELRHQISKSETIRFLRSIPRNTPNRASFYVVASGKGLRLSQVKTDDCVPVSGFQRLQLLQDLAPLADELRIYVNPALDVSEWHLAAGPLTMCLAITGDVSRGFSGEGQALQQMTSQSPNLTKVRAALKWQPVIDVDTISNMCNLQTAEVKQALATLGSCGLVGFDVKVGSYFHRELPFDMEMVADMHPRLSNARKLVAANAVAILSRSQTLIEASVKGSDALHRVVLNEDSNKCTCPWHSKYLGTRGPCKHILATQLASGSESDDE